MTPIRGFKLLTVFTLGCAFTACGNDGQVDIGHDVARLADYGASWDGYGEAASFPVSGSDRVRLTLDGNGHGTLRLGDAALLAPPTKAEGGYLLDPNNNGAGGSGGAGGAFRDGFEYPVHDARVEAGRIRFGIDPLDLYGAWCAFVPPVANDLTPSGYACGSDGGGMSFGDGTTPPTCEYQFPSDDPVNPAPSNDPVNPRGLSLPRRVSVDCGIYALCIGEGVCTCTATSCGAHVTPAPGGILDNYQVLVDAAIDADGTSLTGTLAVKNSDSYDRITIRMRK